MRFRSSRISRDENAGRLAGRCKSVQLQLRQSDDPDLAIRVTGAKCQPRSCHESRVLRPRQGSGQLAVTHLNDALLAQLDLPEDGIVLVNGDGWHKAEGFLIRPPGFDAAKKYPVKFLIHGGPQGAWGDDWSYRWNAELFAANGYVVVMINPRGSTGYGQAIVEEVSGDWGGKPFTDLMTGLDYAEQHYPLHR